MSLYNQVSSTVLFGDRINQQKNNFCEGYRFMNDRKNYGEYLSTPPDKML